MSNDISSIQAVGADPGKFQWIKTRGSGIHSEEAKRTHLAEVSYLMPGVIIFVHGVNSEGEWYEDAAKRFALGLNTRCGRDDLEPLAEKGLRIPRFPRENKGTRPRSPVIPFYWGYAVLAGDCK